MAGFWKPGAKKPEAPASFDVDRDQDGGGLVVPLNRFDALSIREQRERLPIYKQRQAVLYLVEKHATTIIMGQTGSGKTTQVPQYLVEAGWAADGRQVAVTQPRRVAAQSVAARVAEELRVSLGQEVGYSIRFDDATTAGVTKIKFLTDGVLLREMMEDPLLSSYSVVMVDEAHERSVATDLLLGLLKKVQKRRPSLRLIVSSATLEAKSLAAFFDTSRGRAPPAPGPPEVDLPDRKPAVLSVEGRMYPVQLLYLEEPAKDYLEAAVSTVMAIHKEEPPGDILVFLTGQEEVDTAVQLIDESARQSLSRGLGLLPLPLYAGLPRGDQEMALSPAPYGKRKVVLATNVAETSVTLEGVVYVVDCGFSKQRFYNPSAGTGALVVAPISRASAQQRAGRAGRVRPGKCYRLYTEDSFLKDMPATSVPEMQRCDLAPVVLQLKALGVDNIMRFDFLAPPPAEAMVRALELLFAIGFLDKDARLTQPLGTHAAEVPLEPMLAKMLLTSGELGCSEEALTVASMLCVQSVWVSSYGRQRELDAARAKFAVAEGDHVSFLNVAAAYQKAGRSPRWAHENCLNHKALLRALDVRAQLRRLIQRLGIKLSSCGNDTEPVLMAVTAGFFANAAQRLPHGDGSTYRTLYTNQEVKIHPSSVLFRCTPPWVVFHTLTVTERSYIADVAAVQPEWLTEVAPHFYQLRGRAQRRTGD